MKKKAFLMAFLIASLLSPAAINCDGGEERIWCTIECPRGTVEVKHMLDSDWEVAKNGTKVYEGDKISTGFKSKVALVFPDNSVFVVKSLTQMTVTRFLQEKDTIETKIKLRIGNIRLKIKEDQPVKTDLKITTPNATCSVRGTTLSVDQRDSTCYVEAFDGTVEVTSNCTGETIEIHGFGNGTGQRATVYNNSDPIQVDDLADMDTSVGGDWDLDPCSPPEPIMFGWVTPLTGDLVSIRNYAFRPVLDYWVDQVNAAGGINLGGPWGQLPVEMVVKNDGSEWDQMFTLTESMISSGDYDFMLSPCSTEFIQSAVPLYNVNEYILMGAEGGCTSIMDELAYYPYFFSVLNFADHNQLPVLSNMLEAELGRTPRAYVVYIEDTDGFDYLATAQDNFEVVDDVPVPYNASELDAEQVILNAMDVLDTTPYDIFCCFACPGHVIDITNASMALGFNAPAMVFGWGANFQYFYDTFGAATEGIIGLGAWNEHSSIAANDFAADMIAMHGREYMDWWGGLYYYAGLQCFQQAIERAGTLDNTAVRTELAAAWPGSSTNPPFDTVLGDAWFTNAVGSPVGTGGGLLADECHPGEIGQWQDGTFEVVGGEGSTAGFIFPMTDQWEWLH